MTENNITFCIVTQNVGTPDDTAFETIKPDIKNPESDIFVLCRQEVDDRKGDPLLYLYKEMKGYLHIYQEHLHNNSVKNIVTDVFIKDIDTLGDIKSRITSEKIDISPVSGKGSEGSIAKSITQGIAKAATSFAGRTKGAVWVKIPINNTTILIINLHLPMSATEKGLGLEFRTSKFKSIINKLKSQIDNSDYVFIVGDLNFRIDNGTNQLDTLINTLKSPSKNDKYIKYPLHLLDVSPDDKKKFTCRFKEQPNSTSTYRKCRTDQNKKNGKECFNTLKNNTARTPSRCDRILLYGHDTKSSEIEGNSPYQIQMTHYNNFMMSSLYDHNGIMAIFKLSNTLPNTLPTSGGVYNRKKKRKTKRKTKRHINSHNT